MFGYREGNRLIVSLSYSGVPRHSDRHQIEFCMFAVLRICRVLTGQNLVPQHFSISHHRSGGISEMARFVGTKVEFGADTDEFALNLDARELPLIHSDTYLNDLLLKYCEAALADRRGDTSPLRTRVENAISSMLPHGRVLVEDVARSLGMSERTLARKLSDEGLNFTEILQQLRRDLAVRYLDDRKLHVSKIAWLLGFHEVSAFTHAFKRWTGKTPSADADSRRWLSSAQGAAARRSAHRGRDPAAGVETFAAVTREFSRCVEPVTATVVVSLCGRVFHFATIR